MAHECSKVLRTPCTNPSKFTYKVVEFAQKSRLRRKKSPLAALAGPPSLRSRDPPPRHDPRRSAPPVDTPGMSPIPSLPCFPGAALQPPPRSGLAGLVPYMIPASTRTADRSVTHPRQVTIDVFFQWHVALVRLYQVGPEVLLGLVYKTSQNWTKWCHPWFLLC